MNEITDNQSWNKAILISFFVIPSIVIEKTILLTLLNYYYCKGYFKPV